ncbi:large conductance mechanosensitive channel protein MscL [Actinomyces sp.]|uniref:large conductance mechanosensitive channel protein MscL n=1 Tax=Actinomyces sp. TaxID=29317 RepID=UPI0026DD814C|nr:large conductance mechanosensitive channel protein MscL [Actinomyces sp.]MDO4655396.1 large conductance mechanosensitive channel protein MscL [Actinomyces sp.]
MIKGFKEFIAQGNALELAVAVIIGGAFKPIVDSITKVIMTIIGQLIGQPNFDSLGAFSLYQDGKYTFHLATAKELAANPDGFVMPGEIVTTIINFLLIAIAVYFAIVMPMSTIKERMAKQKAEEEAKEVTDVELLTEIRDLLSANAAKH